MYDESIYDEVRRYLTAALRGYGSLRPQLWEDAIQEGMIQAWRDVDAEVEPKIKLMRRAAMKARGFIQREGEYFFGKPSTSRDGIRTGDAANSHTLAKVKVFLEEFTPVHGRMPMGSEVASALGIKGGSARLALRNIKEGRVDHMVYAEKENGEHQKDRSYYTTAYIEEFKSVGGSGDEYDDDALKILNKYQEPDFQDDVVAQLDLMNDLSKLAPHHREVLYYHFFLQYNTGDIGRMKGRTKNPSAYGVKFIYTALNQLSLVQAPYEGKCTNGHTRNAENTRLSKCNDGNYLRVCMVCRSGPRKRK